VLFLYQYLLPYIRKTANTGKELNVKSISRGTKDVINFDSRSPEFLTEVFLTFPQSNARVQFKNGPFVIFQVLMAASMKIRSLWDIAPCSLVGVDRCFRDVYCLHNQGDDDDVSIYSETTLLCIPEGPNFRKKKRSVTRLSPTWRPSDKKIPLPTTSQRP
jgi:hypothetical protein